MGEPKNALEGRRLGLWTRLASRVDDLRSLVAELDGATLAHVCGAEGWSVALVACHVSLGLRRQAKWVELALAGRPPHVFDWERTHALNALVARRALGIDRAGILRALSDGLERWRRLLVRASDVDLARIAFRYQERESSVEWVAGALAPRHVDDHLRSLRKTLAEAGRTAQ